MWLLLKSLWSGIELVCSYISVGNANTLSLVRKMDYSAALERLKVGVPATVEHPTDSGPETAKWVAETTQVCYRIISTMLVLN